jgi:dipeptidyl-peptidase 4
MRNPIFHVARAGNLAFLPLLLGIPSAKAQEVSMAGIENRIIAEARVSPHWLPGGDSFWYEHDLVDGGSEFVFVDALKRTRQSGLDQHALSKHLHAITKRAVDPESLVDADAQLETLPANNEDMKGRILQKETASPFSAYKVIVTFVNRGTGPLTVEWFNHAGDPEAHGTIDAGKSTKKFSYAGHVWRLTDQRSGTIKLVYGAPKEESSDVVVVDESMTWAEGDLGTQTFKTPADSQAQADVLRVFVRAYNVWTVDKNGREQQITKNATKDSAFDGDRVFASPDGRYAVVWQYTPEQEHKVYLLESSPTDQLQPKLKTIQYLKPGDRVRIERPRLFSLENKTEVPTDNALFKNPYELLNVGWGGGEYRFIYNERGHQTLRVLAVNTDGRVRAVVDEKSDTFIDYSGKMYRRVMGNEMLWASERDGWNHLYLYDLANGTLKNQVTKGDWLVRSVEKVDEKARRIWFKGFGMIAGQDPYYAHLARINFDGSGLKILTEGDGTHSWNWSSDGRRFTDTWSRVDNPPTTVLRDAETGEMAMVLQNSSTAFSPGPNTPERFAAPGRDGKTMIYGVIVRPSNFNPAKKYPILEDIYAGPQNFFAPKSFASFNYLNDWANKGYVVVKLDGMGTNWRHKAFHNACHKNLHDAGLPDRIAWIRAAATSRPWMDTARVGLKGASAGGQNTGSALLFHGDFYSVGAADSGCHDNRMDKIWWNEQWMGWPVGRAYEDASNVVNAARLRGKLMLIVGDLDDNVDPSSTMQFANALNKADKDYELVVIPGGKHGCGSSAYGQRRQSEFFAQHLQGA